MLSGGTETSRSDLERVLVTSCTWGLRAGVRGEAELEASFPTFGAATSKKKEMERSWTEEV